MSSGSHPESWIVVNGRIVPDGEASISPSDRGFLYGDGLFETMKARNGRVDFLAEHLARMQEGANDLGIPFSWKAGVPSMIEELLQRNGLHGTSSVKVCLSRGMHQGALSLYPPEAPTLVIFVRPYQDPDASRWERGLHVAMEREIRQNPASGICHIKSLNYLPYLMARTRAEKMGFEESLLLNAGGDVCECSTSNIFCFQEDGIETPQASSGLLPGILRSALMRFLEQEGQPVREVRLSPDRLLRSREIFVTNSLVEILPVSRVDDRRFPDREQTRTLLEQFRAFRDTLR